MDFDPSFDGYVNSEYAQQAVDRYQGREYYTPGFGSGDNWSTPYQNWSKGYYRYENNMSMPTAMAQWAASMFFPGSQGMPVNRRSFSYNLDVYRSNRMAQEARMALLQRSAIRRLNEMGRNVAAQRQMYYGADQERKLESTLGSPFGGMLISGAHAIAPHVFEQLYGFAGSGIGMFDAGYAQSSYFTHRDGTRWSPTERAGYASQLMQSLYWDPQMRARQQFGSEAGGAFWGMLAQRGLLGDMREGDVTKLSQEEMTGQALEFFKTHEIDENTDPRIKQLHKDIQIRQGINAKRQALKNAVRVSKDSRQSEAARLKATEESQKLSEELSQMEQAVGIESHLPQGDAIRPTHDTLRDAGDAVRRLKQHQQSRPSSPGKAQDDHDRQTQQLVAEAEKKIKDAGLTTGSEGLRVLGPGGVDNLRQAEQAISNANIALTRYEEASQKKAETLGTTERAVRLRDVTIQTDQRIKELRKADASGRAPAWDALEAKVQEVQRLKAKGASDETISRAMAAALEAAGGDATAESVVRVMEKHIAGSTSLALDTKNAEDVQAINKSIQHMLDKDTKDARKQMDLELMSGGLQIDQFRDLKAEDIGLDGLVSMSDAVRAMLDDPRMRKFLQNSALMKQGTKRFMEYTEALRSLQDAMTNPDASPDALMATLSNFAGGDLHQVDPTKLKHTIQRTYALARQLGQGDEYVAAMVGQGTQMAASLGLNRQFGAVFAEQGMAFDVANRQNPALLGLWDTAEAGEVSQRQKTMWAGFTASEAANHAGAMLRLFQERGKDLIKGSNVERWREAVDRGDTLFEFRDAQGNKSMQTINLSKADLTEMASLGFRGLSQTAVDTEISNKLINSQMLFKYSQENPAAMMGMGLAFMTNAPVTMISNTMASRLLNGADFSQLGLGEGSYGTVQGAMRQVTQDLLNSDLVAATAKAHGVDMSDLNAMAKIGTYMAKKRFATMAATGTGDEKLVGEQFTKAFNDAATGENFMQNFVTSYGGLQNISFDATGKSFNALAQDLNKTNVRASQQAVIASQSKGRIEDAYRINLPQSMRDRVLQGLGSGMTPTEIMRSALNIVDVGQDSPIYKAMQRFDAAEAALTSLQTEILELQYFSPQTEKEKVEKARRLEDLQDREGKLKQLVNKEQVNLQAAWKPHLDTINAQYGSDTRPQHALGLDLDSLNQRYNVIGPDGKLSIRKAAKDDIRMHKNAAGEETGLLEVYNAATGQWDVQKDASYFIQETAQDDAGNPINNFRQAYYKDDKWRYYDTGKEVEEKAMERRSAGTMIVRRGPDGKTYETNSSMLGRGLVWRDDSDGKQIKRYKFSGGADILEGMDAYYKLEEAIRSGDTEFVEKAQRGELHEDAVNTVTGLKFSETNKGEQELRRLKSFLGSQVLDPQLAALSENLVKQEVNGLVFHTFGQPSSPEQLQKKAEEFRQYKEDARKTLTDWFEKGAEGLTPEFADAGTRDKYQAWASAKQAIAGNKAKSANRQKSLDKGDGTAEEQDQWREEIAGWEAKNADLEKVQQTAIDEAAGSLADRRRLKKYGSEINKELEGKTLSTVSATLMDDLKKMSVVDKDAVKGNVLTYAQLTQAQEALQKKKDAGQLSVEDTATVDLALKDLGKLEQKARAVIDAEIKTVVPAAKKEEEAAAADKLNLLQDIVTTDPGALAKADDEKMNADTVNITAATVHLNGAQAAAAQAVQAPAAQAVQAPVAEEPKKERTWFQWAFGAYDELSDSGMPMAQNTADVFFREEGLGSDESPLASQLAALSLDNKGLREIKEASLVDMDMAAAPGQARFSEMSSQSMDFGLASTDCTVEAQSAILRFDRIEFNGITVPVDGVREARGIASHHA